ncbi:hypothetical protein AB7286_14800, partial [Cylindrospermopsis raciborskii UAM/DH-KmRr]
FSQPEIFLYLKQYEVSPPWQGLLILPSQGYNMGAKSNVALSNGFEGKEKPESQFDLVTVVRNE